MNTASDTSFFVTAPHIQSSDLTPGVVLQVCWAPDRRCHFRHLGEGRYEVLLSENSKLSVGDRFHCASFIQGMPTYLDSLVHQGSEPLFYVFGKQGGITEVSIVNPKGDVVIKKEDLDRYLSQRIALHTIVPSREGASHGVVPIRKAIDNALRVGVLEFDGQQLYFPASLPERECGFIARCLRAFYTFPTWNEIDAILVRRKHSGASVKGLRQVRAISPFEHQGLADQLLRQIFLPAKKGK